MAKQKNHTLSLPRWVPDPALPWLRGLRGADRQRGRRTGVLQGPVAQPGEGGLLHGLHLLLLRVVPRRHAERQGEAEDSASEPKTLAPVCTRTPGHAGHEDKPRWR